LGGGGGGVAKEDTPISQLHKHNGEGEEDGGTTQDTPSGRSKVSTTGRGKGGGGSEGATWETLQYHTYWKLCMENTPILITQLVGTT
jgi:hypothetical protein